MLQSVIIGGGIAGCSTAFALAKRGYCVTLIERHALIAAEASGNPVAMLYPKLSANKSLANDLMQHGFQFTISLLETISKNNTFFSACGQLQLAFNAAEHAKQNRLLNKEYANNNQWLSQILNAQQASEIAGIHLTKGGLFLPQAGWVKPAPFCQALLNLSLIKVITNCQALTLKKTENGWRVRHKDGFIEADNVVLCNANDIKQFGFCDSAIITPVRGQLDFFAENIVSKNLKTIICSDHYLSPAIDDMHALGTTYSPNDLNTAVSALDTQSNLAALMAISPDILQSIDTKSITSRVAFRSQTIDYRPLAGQLLDEERLRQKPPRYNANSASLPWLHGLYVNAGHGSKGLITAPICGEMIASLIAKTDLTNDTKLNTKLNIKSETKLEINLDAKLASSMNPSRFLLRELGLKQLAASLIV